MESVAYAVMYMNGKRNQDFRALREILAEDRERKQVDFSCIGHLKIHTGEGEPGKARDQKRIHRLVFP